MLAILAAAQSGLNQDFSNFLDGRQKAYEALSEEEQLSCDSLTDMEEADYMYEQLQSYWFFL